MRALVLVAAIANAIIPNSAVADPKDKEAMAICLTGATSKRDVFEEAAESLPNKTPQTIAIFVNEVAKTRGWGSPVNDPRTVAFLNMIALFVLVDVPEGPDANRVLLTACLEALQKFYASKLEQ